MSVAKSHILNVGIKSKHLPSIGNQLTTFFFNVTDNAQCIFLEVNLSFVQKLMNQVKTKDPSLSSTHQGLFQHNDDSSTMKCRRKLAKNDFNEDMV